MLENMLTYLRKSFRSAEGATAVEYGVMVALIAAVVIVGALALGGATNAELQCTATSIQTTANAC